VADLISCRRLCEIARVRSIVVEVFEASSLRQAIKSDDRDNEYVSWGQMEIRAKGKNTAEKNVPRNNDATFDSDSKLSIRRRMQRDYAPSFRICRITDFSQTSIRSSPFECR